MPQLTKLILILVRTRLLVLEHLARCVDAMAEVRAAALRRRAVSLERPAYPSARPTVQSGRLFQLAAIALLGLAALISAAPVEAQSVAPFVSNFRQGQDSDTFTRGVRAQSFNTGWDAGRFTLHSVDIRVQSSSTIQGNAQSRFSMYLCPQNANGFPPVAPDAIPTHASCVTLTPPSSFAAPATLTFTAPANTRLERGTRYILVNIATSGTPLYDATLSDGEDGDSAAGWAIGNEYVWYNSHHRIRRYLRTGTRLDERGRVRPVTGPNQALRIAINGTVDTGPTSSDKTVTTNEDEPHRFVVADFPFSGLESADRLWGVKITSLPSAGELKLGTTLVTANQVIRSSDLDTAGIRLGFTPAANAHGDSYGSFTFMVMSGETTESAGGYTMTVAVTPVNDAAIGKPTISGPALVGRSLTAATADIADIDGLPATPSFTYQWVRVDGSDETDISGATSGAYTLAAADEGKKVKVKVSFTDNDGTVETRTSDAYPSGTVAMSVVNAAPTAADQTVTTNEDTAYTFSAADFNFADTDTGNTLSNVKIVTLPASDKGMLKLDNTAVTAQQSVSKADLDADKLTFTPVANANGQARFTFKVSDGTDESASAYAMTVDVTTVNDAATGAPTIFGASWVGQTVTAETSGIADIDGLPATPSFTYQWVRVDGSDETDISGATSGTYTLAAADEGKTVKVKVSFTDNDGTVETLTSDAFPSSDSVEAATTQSPDGIWSATLRVHRTRYGAGCNSQSSSGRCTSQLNDRDFTLAGDRYVFHRIALSYLNAFHIKFEYEGNFSPAELRKLTLYVDGASFPINTGEVGVGGRIVTWENSGIPFSSWYNGKRVNLRLTAPKAGTPSAPRSLVATGANGKVNLTWSAPEIDGGGGISDYEYRYSEGASVAEDTLWISAGKDLKETVTGLTNAAAYAFEVRAVNRAGKSTAVTATATPTATACSAPALGGRHVVWTGKVNVASGSYFYGYDDTHGGSLDDSSLDFGVHSYVVDGAFIWRRGPTSDSLVLSFTRHLPSSLLAKLTFHVCDSEGFTLADATRFGSYHYRWNNSGLDWSEVAERTLYLSIPVASCAAPALGDRRQVWTGKVEVATHPDFFGYDGTQGGGLENPNFSVGDHNNTVDGAFLQRGADTGKLILSFKNALWSRLRPRLTFHVCDDEFVLSNTSNFGPNHYRWNDDMGLDWSELLERTLYLSQPANNAATGMPSVSGTANVGQTLTASNSDIADTDGLPTSFAYQWVRVDGSDETGISGETSDTYTLAEADVGKKIRVVVSFTDIFDGEETVTSDAFPSDSTVQLTGLGTQGEGDPFTASFEGLPESHNGSDAITFELRFSEAPEGLSYTTVAGGLLEVTGATVDAARRLTAGSNLAWEVTVTPSQSGDIAIRLPARACTETNAVCVGGSPLGEAVSATVPGIPFTASFSAVPAEHDGATAFDIRFHLSAEPAGLSYRTVQNGLFDVTGGSIEKASRLVAGKNNGWTLRILPSGSGDVTVRVKGTSACDTAPGVCTADGRKLAGGLTVSTAGPATLSVADATAEEGADATLEFTVTLSKARYVPTTVRYATADDSAAAGSDYTATSGTLTFGRLETSKTISVPILDDAIDEGSETMTLTLSEPSDNVRLADATATGTITNTDHFQKAWLSRFGRTVGTHLTDAISERVRENTGQDSHMTIGGHRLPLGESEPGDAELEADPLTALLTGLAGIALGTNEAQPGEPLTVWVPSVRPRDVLLASSFRLDLGAGGTGGGPRLAAWGRVAGTQFGGRDGLLSIDGDVLTGTVGIDGTWDRWLAGMAVSHTRADGSAATDTQKYEIDQALTSIHPYLRYAITDRLDVWGMLGYGRGELDLKPANAASRETDTEFLMGSVGSRGILLPATETGGFELATRTDAMFTHSTSDAVSSSAANGGNLAAGEGDAHRVRLILEGSREVTWVEGRSFKPTMEVGLRHDWGDAETGFGLELGGRIRYADPRLGLTIEAAVRGLLAHEDNDYDEWGASSSLRIAPGSAGQGLALTLAPTWGVAESGVAGLWDRQTTEGLAQNGIGTQTGRLNAEVGYGAPFGAGLLTPYAGTVLSDGAGRAYRVGGRLLLTGYGATGLAVTLEGQRQESSGQQPLDQGLRLQATWGF